MANKAFDHSKYQNWIDPNEVVPYEKNAKLHDDKQIGNIANSIKRFGWQQDTVITKDKVLVIGHGRRLAALKLGCEMPYHLVDKTADELTDDDIRELRIADNQTNSETGFDFNILNQEISDLDFDGFDFDLNLVAEEVGDTDNPYTSKTDIPQYEVTGEDVGLDDLMNMVKTDELIQDIEMSSVPPEIKQFLRVAAYRHTFFNYQKIAEFYAKADPETQKLMEDSALVIIDINDAISKGYAMLKDDISEIIMGEDYE